MSVFFRISLIYFVTATAITIVLRDDFLSVGTRTLLQSFSLFEKGGRMLPVVVLLLAVTWYTSPTRSEFFGRLRRAGLAAVVCCLFMASFTSIKSILPLLSDALGTQRFFADPALAAVDRALHFGTDPWVFAHWLTQSLRLENFAEHASIFYGLWWAIPALYLPAVMQLLGEDRRTFLHFVTLYAFAWIVLGNFAALAGLSAGPIFYDRVVGGDSFAGLHAALSVAGTDDTWIGRVQTFLWSSYVEGLQAVGSGISAFPSLHLASATITALYLAEKSRWLGVFGWAFVGLILFASVWTGYHYAIDGYFSIAVIYALHRYLRAKSSVDASVEYGVPSEAHARTRKSSVAAE